MRSLQDVTSGLVLCCLAVEYVSFSKRFMPELVNFLAGTLHLAVQDKTSIGRCTLMFCEWFHQVCHGGFNIISICEVKLSSQTLTLCCRLHCGATLQAIRKVQWSAGVVELWVLQELEQEKPSAVGHATPRLQKRPGQRSPQVGREEGVHLKERN